MLFRETKLIYLIRICKLLIGFERYKKKKKKLLKYTTVLDHLYTSILGAASWEVEVTHLSSHLEYIMACMHIHCAVHLLGSTLVWLNATVIL